MLNMIFEKYDGQQMPTYKKVILGIQHTFTMFGATVLVPMLTGMDISVALFMAGISTLIFHLLTKGKVPAFMGSSFAFIAPTIAATLAAAGFTNIESISPKYKEFLPYAQGGIVVAGVIYILFAILIMIFGCEKIISFFPPIVTGPIIMVIGLKLAPVAIEMASGNWWIALVSFCIVAGISVFGKGFFQVLPVLFGLIGGYIFSCILGVVDFTAFKEADFIGIPHFTIAKFNVETIMMIAPVAIVTMVEHIGDVVAIGATCNKDFIKNPGLHKTVLGDGVAICVSSLFGGPAATTYSENTGVLALTKVFNPVIIRIAALCAIILGIVPKLGALIQTIPQAVVGGISIVLFGMIASVGVRTLVEKQVDFTKSRNLIIAAIILVLGLGDASLPIEIGTIQFAVEGMALAAISGIILNKVLPDK